MNFLGRSALVLTNLFMVTARLIALTVFAYCFGPGQFFPLLVGLFYHVILFSVLHYATSEYPMKKQINLKIAFHCFLNGLANIYTHHAVVIPTFDKKESNETNER